MLTKMKHRPIKCWGSCLICLLDTGIIILYGSLLSLLLLQLLLQSLKVKIACAKVMIVACVGRACVSLAMVS